MTAGPDDCPCGGGAFATCCSAILDGAAAPTALALMRSRYTAFVRGDVQYLFDTHDPQTRSSVDVDDLIQFCRTTKWQGLEIVMVERGGERDARGVVEFIARGVAKKTPFEQRERSTFRKVDGRWVYVDGDVT